MVQMQIEVLPMIILIIYLIGMLSIGFLSNKFMIKNSNDYLLGGRRIGLLFVAASLSANNVGGGSTTGVATRAFSGWGLSAGWYVLAASVAMIPLAYFAPKIRKAMAYTIPEVITRRFGSGVGTISAVLNIVSLFCLTASQILAAGSVVSSLTSLDIRICLTAGKSGKEVGKSLCSGIRLPHSASGPYRSVMMQAGRHFRKRLS